MADREKIRPPFKQDFSGITDAGFRFFQQIGHLFRELYARTITGTAGEIEVTNGDWVSGDPVIGLPTKISGVRQIGSTQFSEFDANGNISVCPSIKMALNPTTPLATEGSIKWNESEHCPEYVTGLGNVVQINKEIWEVGVNKTGGTVTDGKCVYASGVQGHRLTYNYADAREGLKSSLVGVVTYSTLNNEEGPVTTWGFVSNLNTNAYAPGTKLYLAADATGTLTSTPPSAPNFRIWVATVIDQHLTQGTIFVASRIDHSGSTTLNALDVNNNLTASTAKFGTSTDYSEFEADGTLRVYGAATTFRDINFSIIGLGLGASAPDRGTLAGGTIEYLFFDGIATTEEVSGAVEIDHDVRLAVIKPHIHWFPTTTGAGNVKWNLTYTITNVGTAEPSETTISVTSAAGGAIASQISSFPDIDVSGFNAGAQFCFRLWRNPGDAADTYAADVGTKTFGLHVEIQSLGTRTVGTD